MSAPKSVREFPDEKTMADAYVDEIWHNFSHNPERAVTFASEMLVAILATATEGDMKWVARDIRRLASLVAANLDEPLVLH